jgi:hypothetical protein
MTLEKELFEKIEMMIPKNEMVDNILDELRNIHGYVSNPREVDNKQSLYSPLHQVIVTLHKVTKSNVIFSVYDVVDNGMNWGKGYTKFAGTSMGTQIKFDYTKRSFGRFVCTTLINRISKLKNYHSEIMRKGL